MDALATIVTLLKPQAVGVKIIHGNGRWGVRYPAFKQPSFALVLKGSCWLAVDDMPPTSLSAGDFVLFPAMPGFTLASGPKVKPKPVFSTESERQMEEIFHGESPKEPAVSLLGGYFAFDSINASILLDLLPDKIHIRAPEAASGTVAAVVKLIQQEAREKRPGRTLILTRLMEVMLVETLRSAPSEVNLSGLLAGLQNPQLSSALHGIHTQTSRSWTLASLAREAGMSRSAFADRFARTIGTTPLNYLLQWRMAVAKSMLAHKQKSVAETAFAVGYESASGFSTAFSRETGQSPRQFIDEYRQAEASKVKY